MRGRDSDRRRRGRHPDAKPTVRQVYAIARELCEAQSEPFPETRAEASALIERLREEVARPPHEILASLLRED